MNSEFKEKLREMLRSSDGLKVAFDLDGTHALVRPVMVTRLNAEKGTAYTDHDADWDFKNLDSNYVEMMRHYSDAWKHQWRDIPFEGYLELMRELSKFHDVDILTERSKHDERITGGTIEAMHEYLRHHGADFLHVELCEPGEQDKLKTFDYQVYVDDSPSLAKKIEAFENKLLFLPNRKYNECVPERKNITKVCGPGEAAAILLDETFRELRRRGQANGQVSEQIRLRTSK